MATDADFLLRVYASTRQEELAVVPWTGDEKRAFLLQQFQAQDTHYRAAYTGAEFFVLLADGEPIGRLYTSRTEHELRIMDIALLPEWRGRGVGTGLLQELLAEAAAVDANVSLHIEATNPARRLYDRLGFVQVDAGPVYDRLEWRPVPA